MKGATGLLEWLQSKRKFQSAPPVKGATRNRSGNRRIVGFNPRPP